MKKILKSAIIEFGNYWELTPVEVLECFIQAFALVTVTVLSIRPVCRLIVKIAESIGRI